MLFCPWTLITKSVCLRTILKILVTKNLTILKLIYKIWHILCSYDDNNIRNTKWNPWNLRSGTYRDADKSLSRPGRKEATVSVRMAWSSSAPCLAGGKKNLMTARVWMLLKSRASLHCFRACFLPGRAKDLSAPRYSLEKKLRTLFFMAVFFFNF